MITSGHALLQALAERGGDAPEVKYWLSM